MNRVILKRRWLKRGDSFEGNLGHFFLNEKKKIDFAQTLKKKNTEEEEEIISREDFWIFCNDNFINHCVLIFFYLHLSFLIIYVELL